MKNQFPKIILPTIILIVGILVALVILLLSSCSNEDLGPSIKLTESKVDLTTHQLKAFTFLNNSDHLVVFESGLGDDHGVWKVKNIPGNIAALTDILLYDRGGYGKSGIDQAPRGINKLSNELYKVINQHSDGRKVVLVGHSLGGMIIRDFAIKHPELTAGLLFVDSSHELFNNPSQEEEDLAYDHYKDARGEDFGGTKEARELVENISYMSSLPNLPDVPVIVITSMKTDAQNDAATKQRWFESKEALRAGVKDFIHITTTKSGHYIMLDEPELVTSNIKALLSKLP